MSKSFEISGLKTGDLLLARKDIVGLLMTKQNGHWLTIGAEVRRIRKGSVAMMLGEYRNSESRWGKVYVVLGEENCIGLYAVDLELFFDRVL